MYSLKIFCIPSIDNESFVNSNAVTLWYRSLFAKLDSNDIIYTITYKPFPSYPNGPLLVKSTNESFLNAIELPYINIKFIRYIYLAFTALCVSFFLRIKYFRYICDFFSWNFNAPFSLLSFIKILPRTYFNVILADGPVSSHFVFPSAVFYLSWKAFIESSFHTKTFLPMPPISSLNYLATPNTTPLVNNSVFTICFSGSLNEWSGLLPFLKPLINYEIPNVRFIITSPDSSIEPYYSLFCHPSVSFLGNLDRDELHHLHQRVDAFLVTRNLLAKDAFTSYPSKIARYLCYNKPIFSTPNQSYPPSHKKFLFLVESVFDIFEIIESPEYKSISAEIIASIKKYNLTFDWKSVGMLLNHVRPFS